MSHAKGRGGGKGVPGKGGGSPEELTGRGRAYPLALRSCGVVEQAMAGGVSLGQLSRLFGPSVTTADRPTAGERVRERGVDALVPKPTEAAAAEAHDGRADQTAGRGGTACGIPGVRHASHPVTLLARFEGLGVSETQVRAILHDAGLIEPREPTPEREHGPRRFEQRAAPNQVCGSRTSSRFCSDAMSGST